MNERPLRVVRNYTDSDEKYIGFPEQQGKTRSIELIPSETIPGTYEEVVVERQVYNVDAPHPDNRD